MFVTYYLEKRIEQSMNVSFFLSAFVRRRRLPPFNLRILSSVFFFLLSCARNPLSDVVILDTLARYTWLCGLTL